MVYHQDALIELVMIKSQVAELIIDERERLCEGKQDANTE